MGEKPSNKFGRGRDASGNQASIITSFLPECQALKGLLALQPAILSSTTRQFFVVIFYGTIPTSSNATDVAVGSTLTATALADTKVTNHSVLVASQTQVQTLNHPVLKPPQMEIQRLELSSTAPSVTMMQPPIPADLQAASVPPTKTLTNPMPKPTQPVLKSFTPTGIAPSLPMMKPIVPVSTRPSFQNVTLPSKKSTLPVKPLSTPAIATSLPEH